MTFPWTLFNFYSWTCRRCCYRILKLFIKIVKILSIASCIKVFCTIIQWLTLQRCFTARRVWDCTSWLTSAPLWSSHVLSCFFPPPTVPVLLFLHNCCFKIVYRVRVWEWVDSVHVVPHSQQDSWDRPHDPEMDKCKTCICFGFFCIFFELV